MRVGYSAASKEDLSPQRRLFRKYACFLLVTGTEHLHYSLHALFFTRIISFHLHISPIL